MRLSLGILNLNKDQVTVTLTYTTHLSSTLMLYLQVQHAKDFAALPCL